MRKLILSAVALFGLTAGAMAYTAPEHDILATGWYQGDVVTVLQNIIDAVNEMVTDHATNKTTIDESRTAILELIDDHDNVETAIDEIKSDFNALRTDVIDFMSANGTSTALAYNSSGALTAGDPTASAAALTNSTTLTLTP